MDQQIKMENARVIGHFEDVYRRIPYLDLSEYYIGSLFELRIGLALIDPIDMVNGLIGLTNSIRPVESVGGIY